MNSKAPTLRILGTSVTLIEKIRLKAEQDLGINIEYLVNDPQTVQRIAVLHPEQYDLYDQWFHNIDFVWPAKSIQPIDTNKIRRWSEINDLPKKGTLFPERPLALGGVPSKRLYVQDDGTLGSNETSLITMLPLTHNVDSFIYFPQKLPDNLKDQPESWSWLLDKNWHGSVAVQNDAAIGALDVAMAVQASKQLEFADLGNLTVQEIDSLTELLLNLKKTSHFKGFWIDDEHAFKLISNNNVHITSLWYPTLVKLFQKNKTFKIAKPQEGYRAWFGGLALSKCVSDEAKDLAYQYLNWWLDGWAGATVAKQGLYISNPLRARDFMTRAEWDYWYMGKPASEDLFDINDQLLISEGMIRQGGSYMERMGHIGVWNSVMDEHNYLVRKWKALLDS